MLKIHTDYLPAVDSALFIHVTPSTIEINGIITHWGDLKERGFQPLSKFVFPLSLIRDRNNSYGHLEEKEDGTQKVWDKLMPIPPFEKWSVTSNTKTVKQLYTPSLIYPILLFIYPETQNFLDSKLVVYKKLDGAPWKITKLTDDGKIIDYEPAYVGPDNGGNFPKCTLEGPDTVDSKGGTFEFSYHDIAGKFLPIDFEATAKVNCGYITHQTFKVTKGKGNVKFIPLGLDKGETVTLQIGIGKYTDVVSKTFKVG